MASAGWWNDQAGSTPERERLAFDLKDAVVKFWSTLHEATYRATDGRALNRVLGMKVIRLTTTGRKSGISRQTMLTSPIFEPDTIVLVASNGGDVRDPQWFKNILACPDVVVTTEESSRKMRARVAEGPERARLWRRIRDVTLTYDLYQGHTDRELPIVVLEPAAEPED
jgi:deazaflavin-dependent oxidoreductase (nitroreductase family)